MVEQVIKTIISYIIPLVLGYLISSLRANKKQDKAQRTALMTLLQTNLTNIYFAYEKEGKIPDYVYKNWINLLKAYENLGGDDYVHILAKKMENWGLIRTDILNR